MCDAELFLSTGYLWHQTHLQPSIGDLLGRAGHRTGLTCMLAMAAVQLRRWMQASHCNKLQSGSRCDMGGLRGKVGSVATCTYGVTACILFMHIKISSLHSHNMTVHSQ